MDHGAIEQIGHRGQADVRMRAHVEIVLWSNLHWPEVIKEYKRPDTLPGNCRKQAPYHHAAAQIMQAGLQNVGNRHDDPGFTAAMKLIFQW